MRENASFKPNGYSFYETGLVWANERTSGIKGKRYTAEAKIRLLPTTDLEGERIWMMTAEQLPAIALYTGRAKDFTQFTESGTFTPDKLEQILVRHGRLAKWEEFGHKFVEGNK